MWVGGTGTWASTELPAGTGGSENGKKPSKIRVLWLPFFCFRGLLLLWARGPFRQAPAALCWGQMEEQVGLSLFAAHC